LKNNRVLREDTFTKSSGLPNWSCLPLQGTSYWTDPKFDMEKGKDYDENFSPTPGIAIAGIIT
jgi:hypothetical protein